jgi:transposase
MTETILQEKNVTTKEDALYMAIELSNSYWKLGFSTGRESGPRIRNVEAGDREDLMKEIMKSKEKFGIAKEAEVRSCYEAGRDGFWLHRYLEWQGIENEVVDSSSIKVDRRARRAKNDKIDVGELLSMLLRHHRGEKDVYRVVRVPSVEQEDERRLTREREMLMKEHTQHINRIRSMLVTQGVKLGKWNPHLINDLGEIRQWNDLLLPENFRKQLCREWARLELVEQQVDEIDREFMEAIKKQETPVARITAQLMTLVGIGPVIAGVLASEFFGWRKFDNPRQVGSLAGLTGTPYSSGKMNREQGISKAGNWRVRRVMVELAWIWLRYQPDSYLSKWFTRRFADKGKRQRRIGIVALGRRLLVELWRYVDFGVIPEGARMRGEDIRAA